MKGNSICEKYKRKGVDIVMDKKMKIVCCKYGHHYDLYTYSKCPHCDELGISDYEDEGADSGQDDFIEKNQKKSGRGTEKEKGKSWTSLLRGRKDKEKVKKQELENGRLEEDIEKTIYIQPDKAIGDEYEDINDNREEDIGFEPITPDKEVMKKPKPRDYAAERMTDDEQIRQKAKADDIGKTVMASYGRRDMDEYSSNATITEPVAGWFVCIRGKYIGKSFVVKVGKSLLGRNADSDIYIDEVTVSHEQALVMFEPRARKFYLKAMEKAAFMYVNKELLAERIELKPYDCIEIGEETAFIFIPLCGENFNWSNYISGTD